MMGFNKIAVVGGGLIGAGWAAFFLAKGMDVVVTDPDPAAEGRVRDFVAREWAALEKLGFAPGASQDRLRFTTDLVAALADADFVQENGPERIAFKIELFKQMDAATRPEVILASSSSTLAVTDMQSGCVHPERVVLAHPFNPPHLIPLVEIVGGERTSEAVVLEAAAFFQSLGKKTVCMRQAILGHIANRLQAALWQEAFNLIDKGVATVAEIDTAISYGPGVRWALLGPMMNLHLSGGEGGIGHLLDHLGPANESMWRDLGKVTVGPELRSKIVAQTAAMIGDEDVAAVLARRNDALLSLLQLKQAASLIP